MNALDEFDMPPRTLGLIDSRVVPHAGTDEARAAAAHLDQRRLSFTGLRDGEDWLLETAASP